MGWKRKALAPKKIIAVCMDWDDCIDSGAMIETGVDKLSYSDNRNFEDLIFKSDADPVIFTIRAGLAPGLVARIQTSFAPENFLLAFQFGVEDCSHKRDLGLKWDYSGEFPLIKSSSMKKIPPKAWREIGAYILKREDLMEGE